MQTMQDASNAASSATAEQFASPQMAAERASRTEIPSGAHADFQPMLQEAMQTTKSEIKAEIGAWIDNAVKINFTSLNARVCYRATGSNWLDRPRPDDLRIEAQLPDR